MNVKSVVLGCVLAPLLFAQGVSSLPPPPVMVSAPFFVQLNMLYHEGRRSLAMDEARAYLKERPLDGDVRLLLAKMEIEAHDFTAARGDLFTVLSQYPAYADAAVVLINLDLMQRDYQEALDLANLSLLFNPIDPDLMKKRWDAVNLLTKPTRIKPKPPLRLNKNKIIKSKSEVQYLNEIGLYQQQYYISDVKHVWDYSTIYYGRQTPLGKVYGKLNYSNRLHRQALQGEFEAFPKINRYLYLDVDVAFANEPNLFPEKMYGLEAYAAIPNLMDFSLGAKYNLVDERHFFRLYTGSLSKVYRQNLVIFRPYYFVPRRGETSLLYTVNLRHMVEDPDYYFGCIIGWGKSPDLANLETVNFIVVENKLVNPYVNFPLFHHRLIVNLAFLYQDQRFPGGLIRDWTGGTVGLQWKF